MIHPWLGLKRSSIYNAMAAGTFPKQIPLGERAVGWNSESIDRWINDRIQEAENSTTIAA